MRSYLPLVSIVLLAACSPPPSPPAAHFSPGSLGFSVTELPSSAPDTHTWIAKWDSADQSTQFDITLMIPPPKPDGGFVFSRGVLRRHAPSEPGYFLAQLAAIHEAPFGNFGVETQDSLPFTAAILGRDQSQGTSPNDVTAGGFTSTPPGDWLVTKLFFADGEAELYFNINVRAGIAEFAPKDPEYGPILVPLLASVLTAQAP